MFEKHLDIYGEIWQNYNITVQIGSDVVGYKEKIIEMVEKINDEKFLKQIYTIIVRHIRRAKI